MFSVFDISGSKYLFCRACGAPVAIVGSEDGDESISETEL
jgi:hypothetical protein